MKITINWNKDLQEIEENVSILGVHTVSMSFFCIFLILSIINFSI